LLSLQAGKPAGLVFLSLFWYCYRRILNIPSVFYFSFIFMPILKQAKKALRASDKKRVFNLRRKRQMHGEIKAVKDLVSAGNMKEAEKRLPSAYKAIDKAAKTGVIKKNTAARKKSRLVASTRRAN